MSYIFRFLLIASILVTVFQSPSLGGGQTVETESVQGAVISQPTAQLTQLSRQSPSFLHVQGREILNASGQPILLRGLNMDTYYYSYVWDPVAPWSYATQSDIQYLDSLGGTAIRLALHWRYFETSLGYDLIDAYLSWCEQAGVYVILDMHVVPPEDDVLQNKIWDNPAAQQQFLDLWTAIATRYADRTIVAGYDLYNEPAPSNAAQWWNLAARATAAIRAVDANHILFVENPLIENASFRLMADSNVVYSFHDYSPFVVSHAGANWVGDSLVPDDYLYPGPALTGTEWVNWSPDAAEFTGQTSGWLYWDSGVLTVPAGVEFATLKPSASGNSGAVWFDDLTLTHNGVSQTIYNPGMEEASNDDATQPANWIYWSDSGFIGAWSSEAAHSGTHSLKISSDGEGYGVWGQAIWILTEPLFRAKAGDTFQVRGWIHAPQNNGGSVGLGLDYLKGVYQNYDRAHLLADMQPYIDWGATNNVPLHVGEFGAMSSAPGDSRLNLAADKISVMNKAGLHWTMWTYRETTPPGFGLVHGSIPNERLAEILRQSLGTNYKKKGILFMALPAILGKPLVHGNWWRPKPGVSWQWQLSGTADTSINAAMYDVDLNTTPQSTIDQLHRQGRIVICYLSAGSWEAFRDDAGAYPQAALGKQLDGWPDERWVDIRRIDLLGPILKARMDKAVSKKCDGIEPDNVDGYANDSGFPLTAADQLAFNRWLAREAHQRKLSIGLKNDLAQAAELVDDFDWALNEQCFQYDECEMLLPFIAAGKAVFGVEYAGESTDFCPQANRMNFDWLKKKIDLDAWQQRCR